MKSYIPGSSPQFQYHWKPKVVTDRVVADLRAFAVLSHRHLATTIQASPDIDDPAGLYNRTVHAAQCQAHQIAADRYERGKHLLWTGVGPHTESRRKGGRDDMKDLIEVVMQDSGEHEGRTEIDMGGYVDNQGNTYVGKAQRVSTGDSTSEWHVFMRPRNTPFTFKVP